jgi:type VI secretion system protein ImpH
MAEASLADFPAIIRDLLANPQKFSFSQILRLLRLWSGTTTNVQWRVIQRDRIRVRPLLSLSFAAADVESVTIEPAEEGDSCPFAKVWITATFLGLYGPSSPLPAFYTERLLDEQEQDGCVTRDFLDIFHTGIFQLYARLQSVLHPLRRGIADNDVKVRHMLMSLASFGTPECCSRLTDGKSFLRYAGLFSQSVRSSTGLRILLSDAAGCPALVIHCNEERKAVVPETQRCLLGIQACTLGEETLLGDYVPCHEGRIRLDFKEVTGEALDRLLPRTALSTLLDDLLRNYCREPLEYDVELHITPGDARPLCLGGDADGRFSRLGCDGWLGRGGDRPDMVPERVWAYYPGGFVA